MVTVFVKVVAYIVTVTFPEFGIAFGGEFNGGAGEAEFSTPEESEESDGDSGGSDLPEAGACGPGTEPKPRGNPVALPEPNPEAGFIKDAPESGEERNESIPREDLIRLALRLRVRPRCPSAGRIMHHAIKMIDTTFQNLLAILICIF